MQGWRPVEDLIRWGFAHAPVVMAHEAHSGLAAHSGTAGILRDRAPRPLNSWSGVDALVVSTDNTLTEDWGSP